MIITKIKTLEKGINTKIIELYERITKKDRYGQKIYHLYFIGIIFAVTTPGYLNNFTGKYAVKFEDDYEIYDNFLDAASALLSNT